MSKFQAAFRSFGTVEYDWDSGPGGGAHYAHDHIFGSSGLEEKGAYFGIDLDRFDSPPTFLSLFYRYVLKPENIVFEGIFRKNGSKERIDEFVDIVDMEELDLEEYQDEETFAEIFAPEVGMREVCGLIKRYFRELPQPLLTYDLYDDWLATFEETTYVRERQRPVVSTRNRRQQQQRRQEEEEVAVLSSSSTRLEFTSERIRRLRTLISSLPQINQSLLFDLLSMLHSVSLHSDQNRMGSENLALVFAPNILRPKVIDLSSFSDAGIICQFTQFLIENCKSLF